MHSNTYGNKNARRKDNSVQPNEQITFAVDMNPSIQKKKKNETNKMYLSYKSKFTVRRDYQV